LWGTGRERHASQEGQGNSFPDGDKYGSGAVACAALRGAGRIIGLHRGKQSRSEDFHAEF
jgi:hypothetical protein